MSLDPRRRSLLLIGIFVAGFTAFGALSLLTLNTVKVNGPVYRSIIQGKDLVADVLPPPQYVIESYLVVLQMLEETDPGTLADLQRRGTALRQDYESRHELWKRDLPPGPIRDALLVASARPAREFFAVRDREVVPALLGGDREQARRLAREKLKPLYEEHRRAIDEVVRLANARNRQAEDEVAGLISWRTTALLAVGGVLLAAVCGFAWFYTAAISRAQTAARASAEKFSKVFVSAPAGIALSDLETGRFLEVNEEFLRVLGYRREDLIGHSSLELGIWPDPKAREALVSRIRATGTFADDEMPLRTRGGALVTVRAAAHRIELEGRPLLVSTIVDISDQVRAQERLRQSEQRFRELVDGVRDIIVAMTPDGTLTDLNPAFEQVTGLARADWVGKPFTGLLHPDDVAGGAELVRTVALDAPRDITRLRLRTANGSVRVGEIYLAAQRKGGDVTGILGIVRDATERVQLEAQLQQAQKMEAIGRLAGGVAHDFNNLLTVILGFGGLLMKHLGAADPGRAHVAEICRAAETAANLTRQLLAFSRRQLLQPRVLSLNTIVHGAEKLLGRVIGEDIRLVTALADDCGCVRADAGQIEQVVLNLAVNARDAMPHGGTLTIETAATELREQHGHELHDEKPGRYAMLAVTDTGHGITDEVKARLFEPFFTTKEPGRGTGLGLATVFGIVKQSGGFIRVHSDPGRGASFRIYLPRVEASAEPARPPGAEPERGRETILLVEDDPAVRSVARLALAERGYAVLEAPDGAAALARVAAHPETIHLLLTDVVMPGIGGREVARRLTALRPGLKVLFMSGYTEDLGMRQGVSESAVAFIGKPFTPDGLAHKVRSVLDARG